MKVLSQLSVVVVTIEQAGDLAFLEGLAPGHFSHIFIDEAAQVGYIQEPTEFCKQPIRTRYLGHVTGYQPIRDQYFLIRSVHGYIETFSDTNILSHKHTHTHMISTTALLQY